MAADASAQQDPDAAPTPAATDASAPATDGAKPSEALPTVAVGQPAPPEPAEPPAAAAQPAAEPVPAAVPTPPPQPRMVDCAISLAFICRFCKTVPEAGPSQPHKSALAQPARRTRALLLRRCPITRPPLRARGPHAAPTRPPRGPHAAPPAAPPNAQDMPTWKVVTDVIVPQTKERGCRYVELMDKEVRRPAG
jgi:hypothetical protein